MRLLVILSIFFSIDQLHANGEDTIPLRAPKNSGAQTYGIFESAPATVTELPATTNSGTALTSEQCASQCGGRYIEYIGATQSCRCSDQEGQESRGMASEGSAACTASLAKTKKMCSGATFATENPQISQVVAMIGQAASAGNTKSACESGKKLNTLMAAANTAVSGMCFAAIRSCKNTCKKINGQDPQGAQQIAQAEAGVEECGQYSGQAGAALAQATMSAVNYMGNKGVCDVVAVKCSGDGAANDEECTQFCMKPGRQEHPKCKIALNNCSNQTYASQNVQQCTCMMNPFARGCSNIAGTLVPTAGAKPPELNFGDDGSGQSDYDFAGATNAGSPASNNTPSGGGGFDGGGGGSSAFGANEGSGSGDEALNKDILTGSGGAAGGAAGIFGGGGYAEGGGSLRGGKGESDEEKGLDLRAFLPGGKNDPSRNPASAGYGDPTITKANGLTNFQKVTRKMNEKRQELLP